MILINSLNCDGLQGYKKPAASLIQLFDKSPLGHWDAENIAKSQKIVREVQESGKHIFVCAAGGSGAPTEVFRELFPRKESDHSFTTLLSSVTEDRLNFLYSLDRDVLQNSHWLFISKSGQTAESLFYAQVLQNLSSRKKVSLEGKVTCLTCNPSSLLVKRLGVGGDRIFQLNDSLPGRFSFFTLGGLVQTGLLGINSFDLQKGFENSNNSLAVDILSHFMLQYHERREKCFFSYSHPRFRNLSLWWERSWSESLFKEGAVLPIPSLNSHSSSEMCHAYLEELFSDKGWMWDLSLQSTASQEIKAWNQRQTEAFRYMAEKEGCPLLSLTLEDLTVCEVGNLMSIFFKVLHGLGEWLKVALYSQPFVDQYKKGCLL
ncbi:MAG: hypothetical protein OXB86_00365 [Bdellovibrionales bacterium]|nr:hypothetical protein [Bdellovibrionales bacterium]